LAKGIVGSATDALTEVLKGAALGAVKGAVDAGAKVTGVASEPKTKVASVTLKSKTSISKNNAASNKKTKSGK